MTDSRENSCLFTVGHSKHSAGAFVALLKKHDITAIADVRSDPYSKFNPQFNRESIQNVLGEHTISYVFLGQELGARRDERECYVDGKARYDLIAKTPAFARGLERIRNGMRTHRVALMCAERDPVTCHRMILVTRHLRSASSAISHIREDGTAEPSHQAEARLVELFFPDGRDLFRSRHDLVEEAYDLQAARIAFVEEVAEKPQD